MNMTWQQNGLSKLHCIAFVIWNVNLDPHLINAIIFTIVPESQIIPKENSPQTPNVLLW